MNNRNTGGYTPIANLKRNYFDEISQIASSQAVSEDRSSIFVFSSKDLLVLKSWESYLSLQTDDIMSDVPHLKSRMEFYLRSNWTINQAWTDFQRIIRNNSDEIKFQAGRNGFKILNFSTEAISYEIFRKLLIETSIDIESGIKEVVHLSNMVPNQVDAVLDTTGSEFLDSNIVSQDDIITQSGELTSLIDETPNQIENEFNSFQTEMAAFFGQIGLVLLGQKSIEIIIQSAIEEYLQQHLNRAEPVHLNLYKNSLTGGNTLWGSMHYRLVVAVPDDIGQNLKFILTSMIERRNLSKFINNKLLENEAKILGTDFRELKLDFQIWAPIHGKAKPWYFTRNGVMLRIIRNFR